MAQKKAWIIIGAIVAVAAISAVVFFAARLSFREAVPEAADSGISEKTAEKETEGAEKIKLTYAIHWTEEVQTDGTYENGVLKEKGLKAYLEEYEKLYPEVEFEVLVIPYMEYADKLRLLHEIGQAPDIYQVYSPWGVSYAELGMLAEVPEDLKEDIEENYVSTAGVTIGGEIRGIPTEINDFSLIYNKAMFKEAGIVDENGEARPPKTWKELDEAAAKTTEKDERGNISRYGFAFLKGMDWAVVDPFLCLLFSNDGEYLADDYSRAMFNSPEGVEALEAIKELFQKGVTDVNSNVWDFGEGKAAMIFGAPWVEGPLRDVMGEKFDEEVGVAPIPYLKKPATLQYSWFMGVMEGSEHKKEAWDFLRWFTSEVQPDRKTTRYGDLMARAIKAIPSREIDMANNRDMLDDNFFKEPFVAQLRDSVAEPNVLEASRIKEVLREQIEAAWLGKDAKEALDAAATAVDKILAEHY